MADRTVEFLNAKIAETQRGLYDHRMKANALAAQLEAYVETLRMVQSDSTVQNAPKTATRSDQANEHSDEDDGNNADAVRRFIQVRGSRGTRPADLNKFFEASKMKVHKSYAYSVLARLKKRKEITSRNGKYFPTGVLLDRIKPGEKLEGGGTPLMFETQKEAIAGPTAVAS
jgi:hypothetical protein